MTTRDLQLTRLSRPVLMLTIMGGVVCFGWVGAQTDHLPEAAAIFSRPTDTAPSATKGGVKVEVVLIDGGQRAAGSDSVVWISGLPAEDEGAGHLKISQNNKQFEPRVSVASVGSTVDFPNYDRVFHNAFSLSAPRSFDLGLYRKGKSKSVRFDEPGLVQIYCNIHPHMAAYLMIVDSTRHDTTDENGGVILHDISAGRHTVEGWNVRGGSWSRDITIQPGKIAVVTIELDISSWRETSHLNKHGKEYPPPDDDDFRY